MTQVSLLCLIDFGYKASIADRSRDHEGVGTVWRLASIYQFYA